MFHVGILPTYLWGRGAWGQDAGEVGCVQALPSIACVILDFEDSEWFCECKIVVLIAGSPFQSINCVLFPGTEGSWVVDLFASVPIFWPYMNMDALYKDMLQFTSSTPKYLIMATNNNLDVDSA